MRPLVAYAVMVSLMSVPAIHIGQGRVSAVGVQWDQLGKCLTEALERRNARACHHLLTRGRL